MTKQKVSLFDQEELVVSYNAWGKLAHTNCLNQPVRRFLHHPISEIQNEKSYLKEKGRPQVFLCISSK